jgi:hypothetical protein
MGRRRIDGPRAHMRKSAIEPEGTEDVVGIAVSIAALLEIREIRDSVGLRVDARKKRVITAKGAPASGGASLTSPVPFA